MSRTRITTGNTFYGKLFTLESTFQNKWLCLCECGKERLVRGSNLLKGDTKSCGTNPCNLKDFEDLTGLVFNRLTVISFHTYAKNKKYWNCRCSCGTSNVVEGFKLKSGHTRSCGCYKIETALNKETKFHKVSGEAYTNLIYKAYLNSAKKRKLDFNIPIEIFQGLIKQNCSYCDSPPENQYTTERYYGVYKYTGLDRVNNSIGYLTTNVVPCCLTCNMAKGKKSQEEFRTWRRRIVKKLSI